ncbi:MAG: PspC domain-containing protein [Cyclobacteriaceae bacterium]
MKKNISINIGGIIFHIEEDGYDHLKQYLDSINNYFSTFEDSKEIIDDIENRIAEILLSKLSDTNQVISKENIDELEGVMGTVADFEATIESEPKESNTQQATTEEEKTEEESSPKDDFGFQNMGKRLYRDTRRKLLGGVASGMAHYFNIDALWIRLIILALFFNFFFWGFSGATFLAYVILWIVLPPHHALEEDKNVKKLYRNPDNRVLGGISSGIAAYFAVDVTLIRLLFVISIFLGGAGLLLYIILWIITPEANTITQKMEMQGEPVTLSNIESTVKKNFQIKEGEENIFVKILLFPFRLIAIVFNGVGKALGPLMIFLVEAFRILVGAIITLVGFALMFSFVIMFFVLMGVTFAWADYIHIGDLSIDLLGSSMSWMAALSIFLVSFIPALSISLLGLVIMLKRRVGNAYIGWTLFGFWIMGLIGTAFFVPGLINDFRTENDIRKEMIFEKTTGIATLKLNENYSYDDYESVNLQLRGHSDSTYKAVVIIESRGSSNTNAKRNAEAVSYSIVQEGDQFIFDSEIDFRNGPFRFQEADVVFYIPLGTTFRMDENLDEIIRNTLYHNGYRAHQMEGNDWVFDTEGLQCLTCEPSERKSRRNYRYKSRDQRRWDNATGDTRTYEFENFNEVKITSFFDVKIEQGNEHSVMVKGENVEDIFLSQRGDELNIEYKHDWEIWERDDWDKKAYIHIITPSLESIELIGGCSGTLEGIEGDDLEITLTGASEIEGEINVDYLDVNLTGASKLELKGNADRADIRIVGASKIDALEFPVDRMELQALGASKANVYATESLDVKAAGVSTVRFKGSPRLMADDDGLSTIKKY